MFFQECFSIQSNLEAHANAESQVYRHHPCHNLLDRLGLEELSFARNINGMANGPKTAPMMAQNRVFAPLLSAIYQRRNAHDMLSIEVIIKPVDKVNTDNLTLLDEFAVDFDNALTGGVSSNTVYVATRGA